MASPYWLKLQHKILGDPLIAQLSDLLWRRTIEFFLLASDNEQNGELPSIEDMAWRLHLQEETVQQNLIELSELGIISRVGDNWTVAKFKAYQGPRPEDKFGVVYLIRVGNTYKIGYTKNLGNRLKQLEATIPYKIDLIHVIETEDSNELENYFHKRFADKKLHGEWFQLSDNDVEFFQTFRLAE